MGESPVPSLPRQRFSRGILTIPEYSV
jgi:hypothetical protein